MRTFDSGYPPPPSLSIEQMGGTAASRATEVRLRSNGTGEVGARIPNTVELETQTPCQPELDAPENDEHETQRCHLDDRALEMWVGANNDTARIRLAGQLSSWSAGNLLPIVKELIGEQFEEFELETDALEVVDDLGRTALFDAAMTICRAGGRLRWNGRTFRCLAYGRGGVDGWDR
jgi:hypothetical protein